MGDVVKYPQFAAHTSIRLKTQVSGYQYWG